MKVKSSVTLKKVRKNVEKDLSLESKLASLARQQPNSKTLASWKFNLWVYTTFYTDRDSNFTWFGQHFAHTLMRDIGEPPVAFDSTTLRGSASQMNNYLVSKGYLFSKVTYSYVIKHRKATVKYFAETGPLYTIDSIFFPTDTSKLDLVLSSSRYKTLLKKGDAFDAGVLEKEQLRIQREFQNIGYYYFRREYLYFKVDSSVGNHGVDVFIKAELIDTSMEQQQYSVRNIYIYPDFDPKYDLDTIKFDTIIYEGLHFLTTRHYVDPDVLSSAVFMVQGAFYSRASYECTINRISDLGIFKFANARFKNVGGLQLDCFIYLQPSKKHQISTEIDVGNVEDNIASGLKISFQSKNVVRRANNIDLSLVGGVQIPVFPQFRYDSIFYNINAQLNYVLPKFAFPFVHGHISCYNNPVTKISLKGSYFQQTNYYSLQSYGITYSMEFKLIEFPLKKFIFPILGVNYVFPTYSPAFAERLALDPFLRESFSEQFIPSLGGAFVFSNQQLDRKKNFTYLHIDLETAGNVLYGIHYGLDKLTSLHLNTDTNGNYKLFSVDFAEYLRGEIDVRRYLQFSQNRVLIFRFSPGIGYAYWNSSVLPYIKQFFLGGTNSMRAWRVRSLGPGTYVDTLNSYNSAGDVKLEGNIEYRFNIFGRLKGAAFLDAGNIWLLRSDTLKPGGTFYANQFLKQIAIGTGLGLRLDFIYFILRLDIATRVYDPSLPPGERWAISNFQLSPDGKLFGDLFFQLAVGYPF